MRHENGAKWRSVPVELGPWWRDAQIFIRWARLGVWERLLHLVQNHGIQLGMTFLDGTSVRAHQKAAGARRKGALKLSETIVKQPRHVIYCPCPSRLRLKDNLVERNSTKRHLHEDGPNSSPACDCAGPIP